MRDKIWEWPGDEARVEDCLELNFKYVDYQSLAYLSYSSCVCWISVRATRVQRFLSVRESISASTAYVKSLSCGQVFKVHGTLLCILKVNKPGIRADKTLCLCKILAYSPFWESQTVHSLSVTLGISPFPVSIGIQ